MELSLMDFLRLSYNGSFTVNMVCSGLLSAVIVPPCAVEISLAIASPKPAPPVFVERVIRVPHQGEIVASQTVLQQNRIIVKITRLALIMLVSLFFNFVADPPHRFNVFWMLCGIMHLFPQMTDVYHHCIIAVFEIFIAPYLME